MLTQTLATLATASVLLSACVDRPPPGQDASTTDAASAVTAVVVKPSKSGAACERDVARCRQWARTPQQVAACDAAPCHSPPETGMKTLREGRYTN